MPGADVLARPTTAVAVLVAGFLLLRLGLMLVIGFGNDEVYTLTGARTLELSYFDHPPLHIWMEHFAALVFGGTRWVRLPFVLLLREPAGSCS